MDNHPINYVVNSIFAILLFACVSCLFVPRAIAAESKPTVTKSKIDQQQAELYRKFDIALNDAHKVAIKGPANIELLDQATLRLPEHYIFVPRKEAVVLLEASGNQVSADFFGVIMSDATSIPYIITVDFIKSGFINDEDAKEWNAAEMMDVLKKGSIETNAWRKTQGFPTTDITGWVQEPAYDAKAHKLIWSISGMDSESHKFINYNTFALGRDGYFTLMLLSNEKDIEKNKIDANKILSSVYFNREKRFEDYVDGKDKVAAYGIAALVTGIAAKKLGLIALASAFFIKAWKMGLLGVAAVYTIIKRKFFKK